MDKNYFKPNFKSIAPKLIIDSITTVKKSKYYSNLTIDEKPKRDKFYLAYDKFVNNEELTTREYKVLAYYLDILENNNYFDKYIERFNKSFHEFVGYRGFVRPLLSYIYNYYDNSNITEVYTLLEKVMDKLSERVRFKFIFNGVKSNNDLRKYLNYIEMEINKSKDLDSMEETLKKSLLKNTDKFYFYCMIDFIVINHMNEKLFDKFKQLLKLMNFELRQKVFKSILEIYAEDDNVDNYPDKWFSLIGQELKDPYSGSNTKWNGISDECKEAYRRWNNSKYLYDFFSNKVVGGDPKRLEFWKRYIDSIYRIRYFKDADDALVMEFKNHVFAEFAQVNNALYIYDKKVFSIDYLEKLAGRRRITKDDLKDKELVLTKKNHSGNWTASFSVDIERLGYKPDRW